MPEQEDGMTKYAVVTEQGPNDPTVKEASKGKFPTVCPVCGKTREASGACPDHGTEPFEKR